MNTHQVFAMLEANRNERGIRNWETMTTSTLKSYGIGLTVLRKLAKQVGKDHQLAMELWKTDVYDAKVISLLIDEPKQITREQVEEQVSQVKQGYLSHVFSTCGAPLAKVPFVVELIDDWVHSQDETRRSCAYGLLYELSKSKKKNAPDETYFLNHISLIDRTFDEENQDVKGSMGGALMGIGKRSVALNRAALKVARRIGPIPFESQSSNCEPLNVEKHLETETRSLS